MNERSQFNPEGVKKEIFFNIPILRETSKKIEERYKEISAQLGGRKARIPGEVESLLGLISDDTTEMIGMMKYLQKWIEDVKKSEASSEEKSE